MIIVIMIFMMTPTSEKNNELCGAHDDKNNNAKDADRMMYDRMEKN